VVDLLSSCKKTEVKLSPRNGDAFAGRKVADDPVGNSTSVSYISAASDIEIEADRMSVSHE